MPPYAEFMHAAQQAVKPAYIQMMRDVNEEMAAHEALMHSAQNDIHGIEDAVKPAYYELRNTLARNPAAVQMMHEFDNGMKIARTDILYAGAEDGPLAWICVLIFFLVLVACLFGSSARDRYDSGCWAIFLVVVVFLALWFTSHSYSEF